MPKAEMIEIKSSAGDFPAYIVQPEGRPKAGLIVIHEVWGLSDHIKKTAERFAGEGYLVIAPNLISDTDIEQKAGTLNIDLFNPEKRSEAQPKLRKIMAPMQEPSFGEKVLTKTKACFDYLYNLPETNQKVAVTGFCFGGSYSFSLAEVEPKLKAAIPFYGHSSNDQTKIDQINCPILAFYGDKDENLMKDLPGIKEKMAKANIDFTAQVYPGAGHAFFNDSNPFTFNQVAAQDAWTKTIDFLNQNL